MKNMGKFLIEVLIIGLIILIPFYICALLFKYKILGIIVVIISLFLMIKEEMEAK